MSLSILIVHMETGKDNNKMMYFQKIINKNYFLEMIS